MLARRLRFFTCVLLPIAVSVSVVPATIATAQSIEGVVRNSAAGVPVDGASVLAIAVSDSSKRLNTTTDRDGRFRFSRTLPGDLTILIRKVGFTPAESLVHIEAGKTVDLRFEMVQVPKLLDTVRTSESTSSLTSGSEWFVRHFRAGKGFFTSGNEILLTRLDACDYLGRVPGLQLQRSPPSKGNPGLECHDDRYIVAAGSRCLRVLVDRYLTVSKLDSAGIQVRTHDQERATLLERRRRTGLGIHQDTVPQFLSLTKVAGIEVFRNRSELPNDFSIPMPGRTDPDPMMRCGYVLIWTWTTW
jgi:hypothetical protein